MKEKYLLDEEETPKIKKKSIGLSPKILFFYFSISHSQLKPVDYH